MYNTLGDVMKNIRMIILAIVSILCVGALVYFIGFFGDAKNEDSSIVSQKLSSYEIVFDTDTLEYDKNTDLMNGVSAMGENGEDLTQYVTVSCKPTKNISIKELTYSINKAGYDINNFTRKLVVNGAYEGPSIAIEDGNIKIALNEINQLSSIVSRSGAIDSDDGFGRKCAITATFNGDVMGVGEYVATVTAENILGDTKSAKIGVTVVESNSSIIKLSASSITLNIGDTFVPQDYVVEAESKEYGDIKAGVVCDSDVDTTKAGHYTATYIIKGVPELENEKATLYVTVK